MHKESRSSNSAARFKRFLCSGFGQRTVTDADGSTKLIGSYHMCYRLDGRLIALGVLDLLPHAVSSVYLMWVWFSLNLKERLLMVPTRYESSVVDHDFGKISAMHEIALAQRANYGYYYMG